MAESGEVEVSLVEQARSDYSKIQQEVFGVTISGEGGWQNPTPKMEFTDENQSKDVIKTLFSKRLALTKAENTHSNKFAADPLEADLERAIDTLDGKRSNPDSVTKAMTKLAEERWKQVEKEQNERVSKAARPKKYSLLRGLKEVDNTTLEAERNYINAEKAQITKATEFVIKNTSKWANPTTQTKVA